MKSEGDPEQDMKISLIIPVYNAAEHLDDCLSAATTQDCPEYEVIVVDDCSTDDSLDLATRYHIGRSHV